MALRVGPSVQDHGRQEKSLVLGVEGVVVELLDQEARPRRSARTLRGCRSEASK